MTRSIRVCWDICWRITVWGLVGGAGFGAVYGPISLFLRPLLATLGPEGAASTSLEGAFTFAAVGALAGALIGGITGLFTGLVDGLVLSTTDAILAFFRRGLLANGRVAALLSAMVAGLSTLTLLMVQGPPISMYQGTRPLNWVDLGFSAEWFVWVLIPTLFASVYGWWVGNRIAQRGPYHAGFHRRHNTFGF